ncbi:MAG: hypothetical protein GTO12_12020 [Proteobacteria bacterium]|nr:hypothetical protein [Pseudomonadota bacterium]
MNSWEKIIAAITIPAIWLVSFECRLRNKVDKELFSERTENLAKKIDEVAKEVKAQGDRIIGHLVNNKK